MNRLELIEQIQIKKSMLCVGLDTDMNKLPVDIERSMDGMLKFNRAIIDSTKRYAVCYKINTAFYEQYGAKGWECMEATLNSIPSECLTIADAKRGDIGNTSSMYARAFFENMDFDAITVAPYMGEDSLKPFFEFKGKWVICLGLTSNVGSKDFQSLKVNGKYLYEQVIETVSEWGTTDNLMFVTGATKASDLKHIRTIVPNHFLLVPGVGAQGGSVADVCTNAANADGGLLINASRSILYASNGIDYADKAAEEARFLQKEMAKYL
ncbi:MAG: orotidine-5'-phosphate decarboxylase [bacterium]|nr:orotidine-5'-phosphate decarboxylase [bacterium]